MALTNPKTEVYTWVKIGGFVLFIPGILFAGPMGGYFLGDYLIKHFGLPSYASPLLAIVGLVAGIAETVRIIKIILRMDRDAR